MGSKKKEERMQGCRTQGKEGKETIPYLSAQKNNDYSVIVRERVRVSVRRVCVRKRKSQVRTVGRA